MNPFDFTFDKLIFLIKKWKILYSKISYMSELLNIL